MIKKLSLVALLLACICSVLVAQTITPEQYIAQYKDYAIREMKRMGIPAAITLAQGMHETDNGNSVLVKKSNNHFGIKCKSTWTAGGVSHDDDAPGECFRTYKDAEASYRDHSNFLRGNDRYAPLFKLDPTDYKAWAYGLRKAGYATNPKYPEILISNIEKYNLQQYSLAAGGDVLKVTTDGLSDDEEPVADATIQTQGLKAVPSGDGGISSITLINGLKCVYAEKGTSLLAVAVKHEIDLNKLMEYNDLTTEGLLNDGQYIYLQRKAKTGATDVYVVQNEKSLYEVSQNKGIVFDLLLQYNHLNKASVIKPGQTLILKPTGAALKEKSQAGDAPAMSKPANTAANGKVHEVQAKEGLYGIAKKYNVTVQQLREWNRLTSDDLKIGQQLIIAQ